MSKKKYPKKKELLLLGTLYYRSRIIEDTFLHGIGKLEDLEELDKVRLQISKLYQKIK